MFFNTWKKEVKLHCSPVAVKFRRHYERLFDEDIKSLRLKILHPYSIGYIAGASISALPPEFAEQTKSISYACSFTYRTAFGLADGTRCHNALVTLFRNFDDEAENAMKLGGLDFHNWVDYGGDAFSEWYDFIRSI